jgi:hypothetical protein
MTRAGMTKEGLLSTLPWVVETQVSKARPGAPGTRLSDIAWVTVKPDARHRWFSEGENVDFHSLTPISIRRLGKNDAKRHIPKLF